MKLGDTVIYTGNEALSNGATRAPAVVTRVWTPDMVNLTVFPDCGTPVPATSVARKLSAGYQENRYFE